MIEAFIIYFVLIELVGNALIFLAVTLHWDRACKFRTALKGNSIATTIMKFFSRFGA